jgi:Asp-tRNA(Asn)/Glu-tRNA(Gln) amidotransferase A subunit family amidase
MPAGQTTTVTATLVGLQSREVREAWLHVRAPEGLWRRYPMTLLQGPGSAIVASVFPLGTFDAQGQTRWYVSAATLQGDEIRRSLCEAIARLRPRFGTAIAERFASLAGITEAEVARCAAWRQLERPRLDALLAPGIALVFPTAPCPALPLSATAAQRSAFYATALAVNALAGHAGLPQLTMPAGIVDGAPVGLSLLGQRGADASLLALATRLASAA